jgi:hypothetical protein
MVDVLPLPLYGTRRIFPSALTGNKKTGGGAADFSKLEVILSPQHVPSPVYRITSREQALS